MHRATCSECGNSCEVPFIPTGSRPIFCSNCFRRDQDAAPRFSNNARPQQRPSFGEREMFQATCSECGNRCEVPFRPTGEKPVFCKNCFGGGGGRGGSAPQQAPRPQHDASAEHLKVIGQKVETILKLLTTLVAQQTPTVAPAPQTDTTEEREHTPTVKKSTKKKAVGKKK